MAIPPGIRNLYASEYTRACFKAVALLENQIDRKKHPLYNLCFKFSGFKEESDFAQWSKNVIDSTNEKNEIRLGRYLAEMNRKFKNIMVLNASSTIDLHSMFEEILRYISEYKRRGTI